MDAPSSDTLVSVVIPTRNRAALLRRALHTVLQQTHRRLEILVVDDASTDDTGTVVAAMGDSRIRYLKHEVSRGGAAARNTGIRASTGTVIGFLDDDDQWEAEKTQEQLRLLHSYGAVMCASSSTRDLARLRGKKTVDPDDLRRGEFTAGGTSVLMARAEVLKTILFDEKLPRYQDWDLFIRIAERHPIGYLNKPLVRYNDGAHQRITNSIVGCSANELERQFRMLCKHQDFFGRHWFRRHLARALLYGVRHRSDKWSHLLYVVRRCGPLGVLRAIGNRTRSIWRAKFKHVKSPVRSAARVNVT